MKGIKSGAVLQRNKDDICEIYVDKKGIKSVTYKGKSENGICEVSECEYGTKISGIKTGGPYTVDIDGEIFENILVGDVYILAGQSNMEGFGWIESGDGKVKNDFCRALYHNGTWGGAKHPLHNIGDDIYGAHKFLGANRPDTFKKIGAGVDFLHTLYELYDGVPQAVIPCAHGGTRLSLWQKGEDGADKSLYAAMYQRFLDCGKNIAGMFWYQGCNDAFENEGITYFEDFSRFADNFFSDFGSVPILTVQIGRVIVEESEKLRDGWQRVQDAQRKITEKYENIYMLSAIDFDLDDQIHLSRAAQTKLGILGGRAMYAIKNPENEKGILKPIELDSVKVEADKTTGKAFIYIRYKNVFGKLVCFDRASGYYLSGNGLNPDRHMIFSTRLLGDTVELRTEMEVENVKNMNLFYGYGINPICNIKDESGNALPVFCTDLKEI